MSGQDKPVILHRPRRLTIRGIMDEWHGNGTPMEATGRIMEWTVSRYPDEGRMKLILRPQPPSGDCKDLGFDKDYHTWLVGEGVLILGTDGTRTGEIKGEADGMGFDLYRDHDGILHIGEHHNDSPQLMERRVKTLRHVLTLDTAETSFLIRGVDTVRVANLMQRWHFDQPCPNHTVSVTYNNGIIVYDPSADVGHDTRELLIRRDTPDLDSMQTVPENGVRLFALNHAGIVQSTNGTSILQEQWTLRFHVRERRLTIEQGIRNGVIHTPMMLAGKG